MGMDFLSADLPFEDKVLMALTQLNTKMEGLVGNGQPGKIAHIEDDIKNLESDVTKLKEQRSFSMGRSTIIAAVVAILISALIAFADNIWTEHQRQPQRIEQQAR